MSVPVIVSIGEDALKAVPDSYREAGIALGATRWQLVYRVLVPAARNGLLAAVLLGVGRAVWDRPIPEFQRLTIHKVEVRRDGRWENRLVPERISLAQREDEFEPRQLDYGTGLEMESATRQK